LIYVRTNASATVVYKPLLMEKVMKKTTFTAKAMFKWEKL